MEIELFGLKTCDTCKKPMKALAAKGYNVTFVDVRDQPLSDEELRAFQSTFGADIVNMRSTTWRGLRDEERTRPALELLKQHPTLMKRPIIRSGTKMTLGWTKDVQGEWLD